MAASPPYRVGSVVRYRGADGRERVARVSYREKRDGRPAFVGVVASGPDAGAACWAYEEAIVAVERR